MRLLPHSLRWRLLLFQGCLLAALLAGFASSIFHLEKERASRQLEALLRSELALLSDTLRSAPERGPQVRTALPKRLAPLEASHFTPPSNLYFAIWMQEDSPVATSKNAPPDIPKPAPGSPSLRSRNPLREAVLFTAPVDCILVGTFPDPLQHRTLTASLAGAGILVLLGGLLACAWILTRSLQPVSQITHTAHRIAQGHLAERIPQSSHHSELNHLALTLNSTFAQLQTTFERQARFTADAAHELRTPVAVLLAQTQAILARDRSPQEYRDALQTCLRVAQRMRTLSESLLQLAQSHQNPPPLQPCDLAKAASETLGFLEPLASQKSLQIRHSLPPTPCMARPGHLARSLNCLLENALEYTPEYGWIQLTTSISPPFALLAIANSGPGIPPEELPLIFEPFHRTDKARSHSEKTHCGLGLSIAKKLLESQGATLEAASTPETETVFTLRLPLPPADLAQQKDLRDPAHPGRSHADA